MKSINNQSGSVLLISLVILLVLTILGVSGMQTTVLEEKMAGNMRDKQLAFQAAEATLRAAEQYIDNNVIALGAFDTDGTDGLYDRSDKQIWKNLNWDNNDSIEYSAFNSSYEVATPPRYVIQHLATSQSETDELNLDNYGQGSGAGRVEVFLITTKATGSTDTASITLQSTYGKRL